MQQKFVTLQINCKPIVKCFLENNFGTPVAIPENHVLQKLACAQLFKKNARLNRVENYPTLIDLAISKENFRYDGFNLNTANTQNFNNAVDSFIKIQCRSNLDALLISQDKQIEWKERFFELLNFTKKQDAVPEDVRKQIRRLKNEIEEHEINIKTAIETVVFDFLKLDFDAMAYETVKKDYYRYRLKKFNRQMSPDIN